MTTSLKDIRIVDLTGVIAGPLALQILGDYGANIVRIEQPDGDVMRAAGPMRSAKMGPIHLQLNRNKRCIALDLKTPQGRRVVEALIKNAAVVVHNMRPSALARLGFDYDQCRRINPSLVHVGIVGYGHRGRYRDRPAYDDVMQAASGFAALFSDGQSSELRYAPVNLADRITGITAAHAILAALFHRERTGEGQAVEIPLYETMVGFVLGDHLGGECFRPAEGAAGYARVLSIHRRPFRTLDGHVCVLPYADKHWSRFFEIAGVAESHGRDPRFMRQSERTKHYDEAYAVLAAILKTRTTAYWLDSLSAADIPCSSVQQLGDLWSDAHLVEVGFFEETNHPSEGAIRIPKSPVWMSRTPPSIRHHAGRVGEHTREILRELGYADHQIGELLTAKIAIQATSEPETP